MVFLLDFEDELVLASLCLSYCTCRMTDRSGVYVLDHTKFVQCQCHCHCQELKATVVFLLDIEDELVLASLYLSHCTCCVTDGSGVYVLDHPKFVQCQCHFRCQELKAPVVILLDIEDKLVLTSLYLSHCTCCMTDGSGVYVLDPPKFVQ